MSDDIDTLDDAMRRIDELEQSLDRLALRAADLFGIVHPMGNTDAQFIDAVMNRVAARLRSANKPLRGEFCGECGSNKDTVGELKANIKLRNRTIAEMELAGARTTIAAEAVKETLLEVIRQGQNQTTVSLTLPQYGVSMDDYRVHAKGDSDE